MQEANVKHKIVQTMDRKIIKSVSIFEVTLFTLLTTIGTAVFIGQSIRLSNTSGSGQEGTIAVTGGLDAPMGVTAALSHSRRGRGSPILLTFDALLYGTANFLSGQVILGIVNALVSPFLGVFAFFFIGGRNVEENGSEVEVRKLNLKAGLSLFFGIVAIATSLALLEIGLTNPTAPDGSIPNGLFIFRSGFDSFAAIVMLSAVVLGMLRYRETGFLYILANTIKIILFSMMLSYGQYSEATLLVIASAYFLNALYGMFIGTASRKGKD